MKIIKKCVDQYYDELNENLLIEDNATIETYKQRIDKVLKKFNDIDPEFQKKINLYMFLKMISSDNDPDKMVNLSKQKVVAWVKKLGDEQQKEIFDLFLKDDKQNNNKENNKENVDNKSFNYFKNITSAQQNLFKKTTNEFTDLEEIIRKIQRLYQSLYNEQKELFLNIYNNCDANIQASYKKYYLNNMEMVNQSNIEKLEKYSNYFKKFKNSFYIFSTAISAIKPKEINKEIINIIYDKLFNLEDIFGKCENFPTQCDLETLEFKHVQPESIEEFMNRIKADLGSNTFNNDQKITQFLSNFKHTCEKLAIYYSQYNKIMKFINQEIRNFDNTIKTLLKK